MSIKQPFDQAEKECAVLWESWCRAFRQGAQECREMMARFVEQGGDAITAASIRANWNPEWGADPGPPGAQPVPTGATGPDRTDDPAEAHLESDRGSGAAAGTSDA